MPTETRLMVKQYNNRATPYPKRNLELAQTDIVWYLHPDQQWRYQGAWIEQRQVAEWVKVDDA